MADLPRQRVRKLDPMVPLVEHGYEEPIEEVESALAEAWQNLIGPTGYLPVLLLILASMLSIPLVGDSPLGVVFNVILISGGLLLTVFRSTSRAGVRRVAWIFIGLTGGLALLAAFLGSPTEHVRLESILGFLYLAVLLACFPLVLVRSFQHRKVTVNTVCATLAAYLLIGLIFMAGYRMMGFLAPPFFSQPGSVTAGQYAYFSFITLTTVGYGDLTPGSDAARSIVMLEAVIGQVFLVTTMARVVSLLGEERRAPLLLRAPASEDGGSGATLTDEIVKRIATTAAAEHLATEPVRDAGAEPASTTAGAAAAAAAAAARARGTGANPSRAADLPAPDTPGTPPDAT